MIEFVTDFEKKITYPDNQLFDPATFKPRNAITSMRLSYLRNAAPELFEGGDSLLDIGSNNGLISLTCADKYRCVVGYEPDAATWWCAAGIAAHHGLDHVDYRRGDFRSISIDRKRFSHFTTTYVGNVHHYFVNDAFNAGGDPFLWLKKVAAMTDKWLVIDGPLEIQDHAVEVLIKENDWPESICAQYTRDTFVEYLKPQFTLWNCEINGGGVRHTAVFKRVADNIPVISKGEVMAKIAGDGYKEIKKDLRPAGSLFINDHERIKFDIGVQSDGVFMVTNALPQYFPKVKAVIMDGRHRVGDVTETVKGAPAPERKMFDTFFGINRNLTSVGLFEPQLTKSDYLVDPSGVALDVDIDMIHDFDWFIPSYMERWFNDVSKIDGCPKMRMLKIASNLKDLKAFKGEQ